MRTHELLAWRRADNFNTSLPLIQVAIPHGTARPLGPADWLSLATELYIAGARRRPHTPAGARLVPALRLGAASWTCNVERYPPSPVEFADVTQSKIIRFAVPTLASTSHGAPPCLNRHDRNARFFACDQLGRQLPLPRQQAAPTIHGGAGAGGRCQRPQCARAGLAPLVQRHRGFCGADQARRTARGRGRRPH